MVILTEHQVPTKAKVVGLFRSSLCKKGVLPRAHAAKLRLACQAAEPRMTALLQGIADAAGGNLEGLEHRFKTLESLVEKIERDTHEANLLLLEDNAKKAEATTHEEQPQGPMEADMAEIVWAISDALRYTLVVAAPAYAATVAKARAELAATGLVSLKQKNYWAHASYHGCNDVVGLRGRGDHLLRVEVQFHTPESFAHKMSSHAVYEAYRSTHEPLEKLRLWQANCEAAQGVPVPEGAQGLPRACSQPPPLEEELYAAAVTDRAVAVQAAALAAVRSALLGALLGTGLATGGGAGSAGALPPGVRLWATVLSPSAIKKRLQNEVRCDDRKLLPSHARLEAAALAIHDALTVELVLPDAAYAAVAARLLRELHLVCDDDGDDGAGARSDGGAPTGKACSAAEAFRTVHVSNGWAAPLELGRRGARGGVGLACHLTMSAKDDGVEFTPDDAYPLALCVHTEASRRAQVKWRITGAVGYN